MDLKADTVVFAALAKTLEIEDLMRVGPPDTEGFMWWKLQTRADGVEVTEREQQCFQILRGKVLDKGWDSSGYACMMRSIQYALSKK